jgi:hypothetical protein
MSANIPTVPVLIATRHVSPSMYASEGKRQGCCGSHELALVWRVLYSEGVLQCVTV